ncbi:MAG: hypothetical protein IAE97_07810 [Chthoniobacterales bacterium]|nr:hypothetical protein [Chthoniobacterales bacterium]
MTKQPIPWPRFSLAFIFLAMAAGFVGAQTAEEAPPEEAPSAMLRAWILPGGESDVATVSVKAGADEGAVVFASSKEGSREISPVYRNVSPGNVAIEAKAGEEILAQAMVALTAQRQYTVVAWKAGAKWQMKVFADGPAASKSAERPLRILNFAHGRGTLVSINRGKEDQVPADAISELKLPPKISGVVVKVLAPDGGAPAQSSTEIDFTVAPSAYVVVGPDSRGRMRPRVVTGGVMPVEPDPATVAQ